MFCQARGGVDSSELVQRKLSAELGSVWLQGFSMQTPRSRNDLGLPPLRYVELSASPRDKGDAVPAACCSSEQRKVQRRIQKLEKAQAADEVLVRRDSYFLPQRKRSPMARAWG